MGFPLFVRYLMDDLLQAVKEGRSPEQVLERTPKGFSEYVKEQFKQLVGLVRKEEGIRNLFALLTVAKGALRQDEAEELTGLSTWDFEDLPHPVTRWFSIGRDEEQETYAFAHPLLAEEFRRRLGREAERMEAEAAAVVRRLAGASLPLHPAPLRRSPPREGGPRPVPAGPGPGLRRGPGPASARRAPPAPEGRPAGP
jgi:hypothetical protein